MATLKMLLGFHKFLNLHENIYRARIRDFSQIVSIMIQYRNTQNFSSFRQTRNLFSFCMVRSGMVKHRLLLFIFQASLFWRKKNQAKKSIWWFWLELSCSQTDRHNHYINYDSESNLYYVVRHNQIAIYFFTTDLNTCVLIVWLKLVTMGGAWLKFTLVIA